VTEVSATRGGWLRHVSAWAHHRSSPWLLFAIAFADSSFLPIPPDLLLVPMVLMQPRRIWWLLTLCTLGSTVGAAVGYLIGFFFMDHCRRADRRILRPYAPLPAISALGPGLGSLDHHRQGADSDPVQDRGDCRGRR